MEWQRRRERAWMKSAQMQNTKLVCSIKPNSAEDSISSSSTTSTTTAESSQTTQSSSPNAPSKWIQIEFHTAIGFIAFSWIHHSAELNGEYCEHFRIKEELYSRTSTPRSGPPIRNAKDYVHDSLADSMISLGACTTILTMDRETWSCIAKILQRIKSNIINRIQSGNTPSSVHTHTHITTTHNDVIEFIYSTQYSGNDHILTW